MKPNSYDGISKYLRRRISPQNGCPNDVNPRDMPLMIEISRQKCDCSILFEKKFLKNMGKSISMFRKKFGTKKWKKDDLRMRKQAY